MLVETNNLLPLLFPVHIYQYICFQYGVIRSKQNDIVQTIVNRYHTHVEEQKLTLQSLVSHKILKT